MEQAALTVIRTARYVLRRSAEARREGRDDSPYRRTFHLLVRVLRALILEGMPPENVKPLLDFLDKSGLVAKIEDSRLDSGKRPSQKGGGRGHGQWVTINGTHVLIGEGGEITKGPANLKGETLPKSGGASSSATVVSGSKAAKDHDLGSEVSKEAQAAYDKARKNEANITPKLQTIASGLSCEMRGLEYSVKTASSVKDKIERKRHEALKDGKTPPSDEEIVNGMWDLVRYTAVSPHDEMAGAARKFVEKLTAQGYTVTDLENKWLDANPYNGIHLGVVSREGQKFELQIHSNESLAVKDKLHPLYEERRKVTTSEQRKTELDVEMMNLAKSMKRPEGIDDLENFRKEWIP